MKSVLSHYPLWLLLLIVCVFGGAVVVVDQWTKALVQEHISFGEIVPVIPGLFNLTLTFNRGVAFGVFSGLDDHMRLPLLAFTTGLAFIAVTYFLMKDYRRDPYGQAALGLVLGGAIGNVIDRVRFDAVVDFLDFYIGHSHWPAFNVADSAICVGVTLLLIRHWVEHRHHLMERTEEVTSRES